MKRTTQNAGFTLVEMIVAVGLFAIVMIICVSALLSLVHANRKAQALQSVMNNLNIALDGVVRSVRMGSGYSCDGAGDCADGGDEFSFQPFGDSAEPRWHYRLSGGQLERSTSESIQYEAITAPEVQIETLSFFVVGTARGDAVQPKLIIVARGSAGALGTSARTSFHIQATAVQRLLDL